jgi:hypothetical protein
VRTVELISPPITTSASGWEMNTLPPVRPNAMGVSASTRRTDERDGRGRMLSPTPAGQSVVR